MGEPQMSHQFGDLVWQHLVRKRGLSQNKLAIGIDQDRAVITRMCNGKALTGPQSRERVVAIISWLHQQGVLDYLEEADALLAAAGKHGLVADGDKATEARLFQSLDERASARSRPKQEGIELSETHHGQKQQTSLASPYRGLFAFREEDADFFCGREAFTARLFDAVHTHHKPLVMVIGPSGSGKSSVVYAGLIPQLRRTRVAGWVVASFRPSDRPFQALAAAFVAILEPDMREIDRLAETTKLAEMLKSGTLALKDLVVSAAHKASTNGRILLVADQFEELYTLCQDAAERHLFVDRLLSALPIVHNQSSQQATTPLSLVMTMRADFLSPALSYRPVVDALQESDLKLGPMTLAELQRAIEMPARRLGVELEPGLTQRMLDALGEGPGHLPLLEFALTLLWARRSDNLMTHAAYDETGGVDKALAGYAEEVYGELNEKEQLEVQRILVQLVQPGEGTEDTRRLARREELHEDNWNLVTRLADTRLVVSNLDEATGKETVEIVHEALIGGWDRLRQWLEADRAFRIWQERLRAALHQWESSNKDEGALLRGGLLAEAEQAQRERPEDLGRAEHNFIRASLQLRDREQAREVARNEHELELARQATTAQRNAASRLRYLVLALALSLLVAVLLSSWAINQSRAAEASANEAQTNAMLARENAAKAQAELGNSDALRLAAEANTLLQTQGSSEVIGLLSILSMKTHYSPQGDAALEGAATIDYPRQIFIGHTDAIWGIAFSPDGKYLLTAGGDNTARLWDRNSGKELQRFAGHTAAVISAAFSPDGKYALTASHDHTARLWDTKTGKEVHSFTGHTDGVWGCAFSPDGKYVLTGSVDKTARLWDAQTGAEIRRFTGHEDIVYGVAFSSDGKYVLTAGTGDKTARLWDAATGQELRRFTGGSGIVLVTFSPDGKHVLASSWDKMSWLWDTLTGNLVRHFVGHDASTKAVAFSPDGKTVLTSSDDGTAALWDASTGQELRRLIGHTSAVVAAAYSSDGRYIVTAGGDKTALLWDANVVLGLPQFTGHTDTINTFDVAFSPDGKTVLTGSFDKTARLWDVQTGSEIRRFTGHTDHVTSVGYSPDGKYVLTASDDKTVRLWDAQSGRELRQFSRPGEGLARVVFSPDGKYIVAAGSTTVPMWDANTGTLVRTMVGHTSQVWGVSFSPDGNWVATASTDKTAWLWDAATGAEIRRFTGHDQQVKSVDFTPDGKSLLTCSDDKTARLWDAGTGKELQKFVGHTANVSGCLFSPDGRYALTASDDKTARLWEIVTGKELRRFTGHAAGVLAVAFSPDGKTVLTGSADKTARMWYADYQDTINYVCSRLVRDFSGDERAQYNIARETQVCSRP